MELHNLLSSIPQFLFYLVRGAGAKPLLVTVNVGAKRFVKLYFYSVSCTGLYFTIKPLIGMFWAKFQEKPLLLELPMPMRYDVYFMICEWLFYKQIEGMIFTKIESFIG